VVCFTTSFAAPPTRAPTPQVAMPMARLTPF